MTREHLESYKSKKAEIRELDAKIQNIYKGDSFIGNSTVLDYRTGYPVPQSVVGVEQGRLRSTLRRYQKRIELLKQECEDIENWIEDIEDSLTRRIFRMYFVDGLSQEYIAKSTNYSRGRVSQIISNFLKD